MSKHVVVAPEAELQISQIDDWWRENRPAAPNLFAQELARAFDDISALPNLGRPYRHGDIQGIRRVLMRATRFHVYYVFSDISVVVLAVWSAIRKRGPSL